MESLLPGLLRGGAFGVRAICFDLDDTLIDSESGARERFESAIREIGRLRPDISGSLIETATATALATHPTAGRVVNYFRDLGLSDLDAQVVRDAYFAGMADQVRVVDGALEVLAELRREYRLAIVTNGPSDLQRAKLHRTGLEQCVDAILISGEVGWEKPAIELFQAALRKLDTAPESAVHVGDSLATDVAGANQAGMRSIWLRSPLLRATHPVGVQVPHVTIDDLRELIG